MKRYNVTVNGSVYQVEVEEVKGEFAQPVAPVVNVAPQPAVAPTIAASKAPVAQQEVAPKAQEPVKLAAAKASNAAGEKIQCPMPGTIVKVNVTEGATIKKGDVLVVLEAMKMENEIMSPVDGTVAQLSVSKGAAVNTGDLLLVIS